jgi:hypothetical protein
MNRVSFISGAKINREIKNSRQNNRKTKEQKISEKYDGEELLFADGFGSAIMGVSVTGGGSGDAKVVYDYKKCISILIKRDGMTYDDAIEFLEYNTLGAYVGEHTPIFMNKI